MRAGIVLPTRLPEGTLYHVTYAGPYRDLTYSYELSTTKQGYECKLFLCAHEGRITGRITREGLRDILIATTRGMRDITSENTVWQRDPILDESMMGLSMRVTKARREPFGTVVGRILPELPRLEAATITAHYR